MASLPLFLVCEFLLVESILLVESNWPVDFDSTREILRGLLEVIQLALKLPPLDRLMRTDTSYPSRALK